MKKHMFRSWRQNARPAHAGAGESNGASPPGHAQPTRSKGRLWLIMLLCLLGSAVVSFVAFKYVVPGILGAGIPPELVGTWQVTEGNLQGATLEISWYGTATAVLYKQGKKEITNSSAKVVGKILLLTSRDATTGAEETVAQNILQLTPDELIIQDEDRNVYRMKRVGS
jgi:hypothetical protein